MRLIKKWLFPALTCLIVIGAAVLPPRVSQARDARLFGQVHAELLEAAPLPAAQSSTLLDRMTLYAGWLSSSHPILSFDDPVLLEPMFDSDDPATQELLRSTQSLLTEASILPHWIFEEEPFEELRASRLLLWDAEDQREPSLFWDVTWENYANQSHQKSVHVTLDAQTDLPIHLYVHDTNMSQWLAYDTEHLRSLAQHYFDLLELEVQEVDLDGSQFVSSLNLSYSISGTGLHVFISRSPTDLSFQLDIN